MSTVIVSQSVRPALPVARWSVRPITRWHLFSLDAPSVAVVWLFLLNRRLPFSELRIEAAALAIAVWMIYVLDRLLDARRRDGTLHLRHRFHWRHRRPLLAGITVAGVSLTGLLFLLPRDVLRVWTLLAIPLGIYAGFVHLRLGRVPKEFVVGALFALVVGAPSLTRATDLANLPAIAAFGLLCCCNCLAITCWERGRNLPCSSAERGLPMLRCMSALLLCACFASLCSPETIPAGFASLIAGALLLWLHRNRERIEPVLLRSLSDVALLSPLLVLPLLHRR